MIPDRVAIISRRLSKMLAYTASAFLIVLFFSNAADAQSWAENMFRIKSHDFGNVPLLSDTHYSFVFHNTSKQDIHIASVSSSCSCTDASAPVTTIRSGEKGEIIAKINTSGQHTKKKGATITVQFDKPSTAFVQLEVSVYIRPDIVLNPGAVDFGAIREGQEVVKKVQLQYAGDPNWRLVRIDRANKNPYIHARAEPQDNQGNSREITYNILITLSEKAPAGGIQEILRFITNDKNSVAIELPVNGMIMDPLVAKPSPFQFGSIAPGETVTKYLVLRASQPFRVRSVRCPEDRRFVFSPSDQSSSIHIIAVTVTSKQDVQEKVARTIDIETTLEDQGRIKVPIYARFLSAESVNTHEFYAEPWKPLILGLEDPDLASGAEAATEKKPRLKAIGLRSTEFGELPIDPKTLNRVSSGEKRSEEAQAQVPHPEESPTEPEKAKENETPQEPPQEAEAEPENPQSRKVPPMVNEYPPETEIPESEITQDWVPLAKTKDADTPSEDDSGLVVQGTESSNDWQPRDSARKEPAPVRSSLPAQSPLTLEGPKRLGRAKFGVPQRAFAVDSANRETAEIASNPPKTSVGKPVLLKERTEQKPKVTSRQEKPEVL